MENKIIKWRNDNYGNLGIWNFCRWCYGRYTRRFWIIHEDGLSVSEATERILEELGRFKDDDPRVYLAIASLQIEHGELQEDIKQKALNIIESGKDLEAWKGDGKRALESRKKVLNKLKSKLQNY